MAVKIEGESGLRGAYTDYIQDYLQRMSALLGRRDVNPATGQPDYTGPQFGGAGGGGYGADTMKALQNLQAQREQMLAAGAIRPQFSFARRRAADGGVMSVVPEGYADGGDVGSTYQAPGAYQAGTFTPERATADTFGQEQAQQYMSPFMSGVVDPQLREARRQADITRMQNASRMAKAGSFGGSRQAIQEAELNRNLATQLGDIYGVGQQKAFENAQSQFERDQARRMTAQDLNIKQGLEAQRLGEQSRQFGATQAMNTADKGAYYAQQARELQQRAEEAQMRGDIEGQRTALDQLKEAQRAAEATRGFEYQQARDTYLDPFREILYANQALGTLPTSAAATGISPSTAAIISALGLGNLLGVGGK
jgi:hypothetical protein